MSNSDTTKNAAFNFELEQFADIRILRYTVPGFESLSLKQKMLIYNLGQAALCGRDILAHQNCKYNLLLRKTLENIYSTYSGERNTSDWEQFEVYLKRIWFSNGIHHHYSNDKIKADFSTDYFITLYEKSDTSKFLAIEGKSKEQTMELLQKLIFDNDMFAKKVSQEANSDIITDSAVNFYSGDLNQKEVEAFYDAVKNESDEEPIAYGLNSQLCKTNNKIEECVWKVGGMYSAAIEKIVYWLDKALAYAENSEQRKGLELLIEYYKTGDLKLWDAYNVSWVKELAAQVDYVNGFVEVYSDPMGIKATWESIVNFKDLEATKRAEIISNNAQWFEDNSPIEDRFKKKEVKGVSAKVITVAMLGGDCYPHTPIGINLPNSDWIRKDHGSKSVTIENITYAYSQADLTSGFLEEFSVSDQEMALVRKYGSMADNLHTDLHECLGHGSGQMLAGVSSEMLKNYHSPLEETRADLFALYFMLDPKTIELGLLPSLDAAKAHYISYIRNGIMTQLRRIEQGKNVEQAHMRNRQLIASWAYEKGLQANVIERVTKDNKVFYRINDFEKLRMLFGELLMEVQRIKSVGDYEAGKKLVEDYGVKVDATLHKEVIERFSKLKMPAFSGFVNPDYELVLDGDDVVDVKVNYVDDYAKQMMNYGTNYSYLAVSE